MKLIYQKHKGQRILRAGFWGFYVPGYEYFCDTKKWYVNGTRNDIRYWSTMRWCRSVKAFRRHLRNNPEIRNKVKG